MFKLGVAHHLRYFSLQCFHGCFTNFKSLDLPHCTCKVSDLPPCLQLALDASPWSQVTYSTSNIDSASTGTELEAIVMTKGTSLSVCLIRTSDGIEGVPFINAVELRPVRNNMYLGRYDVPSKYFLKTLDRPDFGPPLAKTRWSS